jgi:hypothetical protein
VPRARIWRLGVTSLATPFAVNEWRRDGNRKMEGPREAYQKALRDPLIVRSAGAALDRAGQLLQVADKTWAEERDVAEVRAPRLRGSEANRNSSHHRATEGCGERYTAPVVALSVASFGGSARYT